MSKLMLCRLETDIDLMGPRLLILNSLIITTKLLILYKHTQKSAIISLVFLKVRVYFYEVRRQSFATDYCDRRLYTKKQLISLFQGL